MILSCLLALIVGTWNGNWFPSGRAEHRAHPEVEAATISASARMLDAALDRLDPDGEEDVIISLCEIRNREAAERLVEAMSRDKLKVAAVSAYRRRDRFDQQQNVILTTLPVVEGGWGKWKDESPEKPPRGYAYAKIVVEPAVTSLVYSVHLKSNYGATSEEIALSNRQKRSVAIDELIEKSADLSSVIIAGDFNADPWRKEFTEETLFAALESASFSDLLALLPPKARGTHPNRRYGNSCLDHIMTKGFAADGVPLLQDNEYLSDHRAVFARVKPISSSSQARHGTSRRRPQTP